MWKARCRKRLLYSSSTSGGKHQILLIKDKISCILFLHVKGKVGLKDEEEKYNWNYIFKYSFRWEGRSCIAENIPFLWLQQLVRRSKVGTWSNWEQQESFLGLLNSEAKREIYCFLLFVEFGLTELCSTMSSAAIWSKPVCIKRVKPREWQWWEKEGGREGVWERGRSGGHVH